MSDVPRNLSRLAKPTMWLVLWLSSASLFVSLFPYGDSIANRLALPFPAVLIGSSLYLLVGRWRGFIDDEQLSLFGRAWIVFATGLAIVSAVVIRDAGSGTSDDELSGLGVAWLVIGVTVLPSYLAAKYRFSKKPKR